MRVLKPIVPLGIILFFMTQTYYMAQGIEQGHEYEVAGGSASGQAAGGVLIGIADSLGSTGVLVLCCTLCIVPVFLIVKAILQKKIVTEI